MSSNSEQALGVEEACSQATPPGLSLFVIATRFFPESLRDLTGEDTVEVAERNSLVQPVQRLLFLVFT